MTLSARRVIFLHGVGSNGAAMGPLADALGLALPVACPDGLHAFDMGAGRQWFSVKGVTEANRPDRIAAALPDFVELIEKFGNPRDTLLVGFSQGAIMALHAVASGLPAVGVIALSGRLAGPVSPRSDWPPITMLHGNEDPIMPPAIARDTAAWLQAAGANPRLRIFDGLGHTIDGRMLAAIRDTLSPSNAEQTSPGG
jgi:phospholipase/carboxylesterase